MPLATIYFMNGMVAAFRNAITAETHSHHAAQITLDLEGQFEVFSNDTSQTFQCALIPPNLSHRINASGHWQITILLDPELEVTNGLLKHFKVKDKPVEIPAALVEDVIKALKNTYTTPIPIADLKSLITTKFKRLANLSETKYFDTRIDALIHEIKNKSDLNNIDDILNKIPLSKSRLSHLFVEQSGISLRRYLLWAKVRRSVTYMLQGESITDSAHHAGFSDLSHLSRSFKSMFGINVSVLFQTKDYINFHID